MITSVIVGFEPGSFPGPLCGKGYSIPADDRLDPPPGIRRTSPAATPRPSSDSCQAPGPGSDQGQKNSPGAADGRLDPPPGVRRTSPAATPRPSSDSRQAPGPGSSPKTVYRRWPGSDFVPQLSPETLLPDGPDAFSILMIVLFGWGLGIASTLLIVTI